VAGECLQAGDCTNDCGGANAYKLVTARLWRANAYKLVSVAPKAPISDGSEPLISAFSETQLLKKIENNL
jgi:hypothetical protein